MSHLRNSDQFQWSVIRQARRCARTGRQRWICGVLLRLRRCCFLAGCRQDMQDQPKMIRNAARISLPTIAARVRRC